jgi:hypothetical protein
VERVPSSPEIVTATPGNTAPDGSVTAPSTLPVWIWAETAGCRQQRERQEDALRHARRRASRHSQHRRRTPHPSLARPHFACTGPKYRSSQSSASL